METTKFVRTRARQGDPDAWFRLGHRLTFCRDRTRRNPAQAFRWLRAAAEGGHVRAQCYLGCCFHSGDGTRRDLRAARRWYRRSARAGHAGAAYNLGTMLRDGEGGPQKERVAVRWFAIAASQGDPDTGRVVPVPWPRVKKALCKA